MSSSNDTAASCADSAAAVEFNGDVLVLGGGADEGVDGSEEGVHGREERIHFDLSCVAGELCRSGCWVTLPRCPSTYMHLDYEFSGIFGVQYERPATKEWGRQIQEWLGLVARSIRALEHAVGPEVQGLMQIIDSETLPTAAVHVHGNPSKCHMSVPWAATYGCDTMRQNFSAKTYEVVLHSL